ncbi:MAG: VOC family protein [Dehalococcoidia bacterium]
MQKITPNLWFDDQAEEAARLYTSIFKDSRVLDITRYPKAAAAVSGKAAGSVLTVEFEIAGQRFTALNGGPQFPLTEAVSFLIECEDQQEVDYFWGKLTDGGEESVCGWQGSIRSLLAGRPQAAEQMMTDPDPKKVEAVTKALLAMKKLDVATLEKAYAQAQ